jgi:hypothetical protein
LNEEESFSGNSGALSPVCERDATTIDPVVSGQQLIALLRTGEGTATSLNRRSIDRDASFELLCFALQQA